LQKIKILRLSISAPNCYCDAGSGRSAPKPLYEFFLWRNASLSVAVKKEEAILCVPQPTCRVYKTLAPRFQSQEFSNAL
jgi:hypothetical protein